MSDKFLYLEGSESRQVFHTHTHTYTHTHTQNVRTSGTSDSTDLSGKHKVRPFLSIIEKKDNIP